MSIEQVSNLTQLSVEQLREWDNDGFFVPSMAYEKRRSPYSRIYSFDDVVGLRTLSILRKEFSVSRQHLRKAAACLVKHSGKPWSSLALYVLKREVHFYNPLSKQVEGAVTGQLAVPIKLSSIADDMKATTELLRKRANSSIGHIVRNKYTMHGEPVIVGTRVTVSAIKSFDAAGCSTDEIIRQYPDLTPNDVRAAIDYESGLTLAA